MARANSERTSPISPSQSSNGAAKKPHAAFQGSLGNRLVDEGKVVCGADRERMARVNGFHFISTGHYFTGVNVKSLMVRPRLPAERVKRRLFFP